MIRTPRTSFAHAGLGYSSSAGLVSSRSKVVFHTLASNGGSSLGGSGIFRLASAENGGGPKSATNPSLNGATDRSSWKKIALFIGSDITANIITNKVVPALIERKFQPVLIFPRETINKKAEREGAYDRTAALYRLYERHIFQRVIVPYLDTRGQERPSGVIESKDGCILRDLNYTPSQLAKIYGAEVARDHEGNIQHITNINDPAFVQQCRDDEKLIGAISIRCYQIFREDLIAAFTSKKDQDKSGFVWNLHPAPLPRMRGFLHPPHFVHQQRTEEEEEYSWTLHELIYNRSLPHSGIDAGDILERMGLRIDELQVPPDEFSPIALYTEFTGAAAHMIRQQIGKWADGIRITGQPQPQEVDPEKWRYYNYQTLRELCQALPPEQVAKLQPNEEYMHGLYTDSFVPPDNRLMRVKLSTQIENAIQDWREHNTGPECRHMIRRYGRKDASAGQSGPTLFSNQREPPPSSAHFG